MLKVSPDSITGKIMYENNEDIGLVHTRSCSLYENGNLSILDMAALG